MTTRPFKHCCAWTQEADLELRSRVSARQGVGEIADAMGRTVDAIRGRTTYLHLMLPSRVRPWRRGLPRLASAGHEAAKLNSPK
jgi:hypothetical protein